MFYITCYPLPVKDTGYNLQQCPLHVPCLSVTVILVGRIFYVERCIQMFTWRMCMP